MNFEGKNILIVGGTGSFGNQLLKKIVSKKIKFNQINILSRDEKKQYEMREIFNNSNIRFHIGDIRDKECTDVITKNIDSLELVDQYTKKAIQYINMLSISEDKKNEFILFSKELMERDL